MPEITFKDKTKTITKLAENGITDEKQLLALNMEAAVKLPEIKIQEITIITELQKSIRTNKLFSYLAEGGDSIDGTKQ